VFFVKSCLCIWWYIFLMKTPELLQNRIDAALGKIPCDLVLKNATYLDVFSGLWQKGDLGILGDALVALDPGVRGKRVIDASSHWVVPGFIDAHVHIESSLLTPSSFQKVVLPKGTTTAICDPHELANVQGVTGIQYFLEEAQKLKLDLRIMLSSCVPATGMETNGGGSLEVDELLPWISHPKALGLAEMMNFPGVLNKDPNILKKLTAFSAYRMDGHCPLLRGKELSAYAAAGISSCHESSEFGEAQEKLQKGLAVWIREGSVAKDLEALVPLLNWASSPFIGFCTDDRNPLDIFKEGHIDFLVRSAIGKGVPAPVAYRSASWSVARHYGLDQGVHRMGALAPGYRADLIILDDVNSCAISQVIRSGQILSEIAFESTTRFQPENSVRAQSPTPEELEGPQGPVHCIEVYPGKIITGRSVRNSTDPEVARLTVLERYGNHLPPANGYAVGFGKNFHGAIASSVGHDSHNLCVIGKKTSDMQIALNCLISLGGGFAVVKDGAVISKLALPFGGLMSLEEPHFIAKRLQELRDASASIGCELSEPFLQLAFLALPVIPSLKMTDKGLVDVEKFKLIEVRA